MKFQVLFLSILLNVSPVLGEEADPCFTEDRQCAPRKKEESDKKFCDRILEAKKTNPGYQHAYCTFDKYQRLMGFSARYIPPEEREATQIKPLATAPMTSVGTYISPGVEALNHEVGMGAPIAETVGGIAKLIMLSNREVIEECLPGVTTIPKDASAGWIALETLNHAITSVGMMSPEIARGHTPELVTEPLPQGRSQASGAILDAVKGPNGQWHVPSNELAIQKVAEPVSREIVPYKKSSVPEIKIQSKVEAKVEPKAAPKKLMSVTEFYEKHTDINALLSDPALKKEWYTILVQKYGGPEKFPKVSFEGIVTQLNQLYEASPETVERMFKKTDMGKTFSVESEIKSYGRDFNWMELSKFTDEWQLEINKQLRLDSNFRALDGGAKKDFIHDLSLKLKQEYGEFEKQLNAIPKKKAKERTDLSKEFFARYKDDPAIKAVAAYLLRDKAQEISLQFREGKDADLVLDKFIKLPQEIKTDVPQINQAMKELIPSQEALLKNTEVFPLRMKSNRDGSFVPEGASPKGIYVIRAIERPIEGIWGGVHAKECIGGLCTHIMDLTPERWALVAIKGTQYYEISYNDSYQGFVAAVPVTVKNKSNKEELVGSLELVSTALSKKVAPDTTLYNKVILKLDEQKPKDWAGFILSRSSTVDNSGALRKAREDASYSLGENVSHLKHTDLQTVNILKSLTPAGTPKDYVGNMSLSTTIKDSGNLIKISVSQEQQLKNFQERLGKDLSLFERHGFKEEIQKHMSADLIKVIKDSLKSENKKVQKNAFELAYELNLKELDLFTEMDQLIRKEQDPKMKLFLLVKLQTFNQPLDRNLLLGFLRNEFDSQVKQELLLYFTLHGKGDAEVAKTILKIAQEERQPQVKNSAIQAAKNLKLKGAEAKSIFLEVLTKHSEDYMRAAAAEALGEIGEADPAIIQALEKISSTARDRTLIYNSTMALNKLKRNSRP